MKSLLLLGGGGHCHSCIDVIESDGKWNIKGIIEPRTKNTEVLGYPIVGNDDDLKRLLEESPWALVTVGQIKSFEIRKQLFINVKKYNGMLPIIQSSTAYCSRRATVGEGTILMHNTVVNSNAEIGENCIINSCALVEHDVYVDSHSHISTGAVLNGGVRVGMGVFVGSNSVVTEGVVIGDGAIIGAGQIVREDVMPGIIVRG